jgi:type I restriction enzyme M protein
VNRPAASAYPLPNRDATETMRRQGPLWKAVDALAGRTDELTAYQRALRLLFLRIVTTREEADGPWASFRDQAQADPSPGEFTDRILEAALQRWASKNGIVPNTWTVEDYVRRPAPETYEASQALIQAVDTLKGNLLDVFELTLERCARTTGDAGDYFTPRSLVRLAVSLADPKPGDRVLDPACGSGGFLLAAHAHAAASIGDPVQLVGRDLNPRAWQIAHLNLLAHGLRPDLGKRPANILRASLQDCADYDVVLVNPPFNQKDWADEATIRAEAKDGDWAFGAPPSSNANFAWLQRALLRLAPTGRACVLMPGSTTKDGRLKAREITRRLVGKDVIEALVMLPTGLFPHTRVSACLWVLSRDKGADGSATRDRRDRILLIDAREMCEQATRGQWLIPDTAIDQLACALRSWRTDGWESFCAEAGPKGARWCEAVSRSEVEERDWDLTPSRYISSSARDVDGERGVGESHYDDLLQRLSQRIVRCQELDRVLLERLGDW